MRINEVIIKHEFDKNDWNHFHDCIFEATHETTKLNCNIVQMKIIFNRLPIELKGESLIYGMNDTCFREKLIECLKENEKITKF